MGSQRVGHDWACTWTVVALQCCVSFRCRVRWFIYVCVLCFRFFSIIGYYKKVNIVPCESESCSVVSDSLWPHGILQARILEWVTFPFYRGSSQPRSPGFEGRFFISWATREPQEYWSRWTIPFPADLPNPGIEPGSPALQADSLPTELWRKTYFEKYTHCM